MAKNKVSEWSSNPANNTDVGNIDIAEGCAPSGINNAIREVMAQIKDMITGADGDSQVVGGNLTVNGTSTLTGAVTATDGVTGDITSSNATITGGTITGITDLAVADGGTGASTLTGVVIGNGASAMTAVAPSTSGNVLTSTVGSTVAAGSFIVGIQYTILTVGTTDFTAIGAASNTVGVIFIATGVGSGTGTATTNTWTSAAPVDPVPSGAVMHFAMSSAPTGWLKANGATISRTTYASLFAAIGTTFGAGDGSTTFKLPDLRGEFVRGWSDGRSVDSGRAFGSAQAATEVATTIYQAARYSYTNADATRAGSTISRAGEAGYSESEDFISVRSRNVALLACIKV